jgi:hypothetical protein
VEQSRDIGAIWKADRPSCIRLSVNDPESEQGADAPTAATPEKSQLLRAIVDLYNECGEQVIAQDAIEPAPGAAEDRPEKRLGRRGNAPTYRKNKAADVQPRGRDPSAADPLAPSPRNPQPAARPQSCCRD